MQTPLRASIVAALVCLTVPPASIAALADDGPVALAAKPRSVESTIRDVTIYEDTATVRRVARLELAAGAWELRFEGLPAAIDAESLVGSVDPPAKLLDVRFEERSVAKTPGGTAELDAVLAELEEVRLAGLALEVKRRSSDGQLALVDAIAARVADGAAKGLGGELDPARLKAQLAMVREERDAILASLARLHEEGRLLGERLAALERRKASLGAADRATRTGVIVVAMPDPGAVEVSLRYLVSDALWAPSYAMRADASLSGLVIEYDAVLQQASGEDWSEVRLTLSTGSPTRSAAPPEIEPIFIDRIAVDRSLADRSYSYRRSAESAPPPPPPPATRMGGGFGGGLGEGGIFGEPGEDPDARRLRLTRAGGDAELGESDLAASFTLPRLVTIASDSDTTQRARIATIELTPEFSYVTRPLVDPQVYLRGKAVNASDYLLLAGEGRVYLGNESLGEIEVDDVPPGAEFTLWFGPDRRLAAKRTLVSKSTGTSGVFSKTTETTRQYRIDLTSAVPTPTSVEVWDRMPVSRDKDIVVTLSDLAPPLLKDAAYEAEERKQGLLAWKLLLPAAGGATPAAPTTIRWTVRIARPADAITTPVPD